MRAARVLITAACAVSTPAAADDVGTGDAGLIRCDTHHDCAVVAESHDGRVVLDVTALVRPGRDPVKVVAVDGRSRAVSTQRCPHGAGTCATVALAEQWIVQQGRHAVIVQLAGQHDTAIARASDSNLGAPIPALTWQRLKEGAGAAWLGEVHTMVDPNEAAPAPVVLPDPRQPAPAAPQLGTGRPAAGSPEIHASPDRNKVRGDELPVAAPVPHPWPVRAAPAAPRVAPPDDHSFADVVLVGSERGYWCTGVLVAPRLVVTAGHCAAATRVGFASRLDQIAAEIAVASVVVHPDGLDAAALILASPSRFPARPRRGAGQDAPPRGVVRVLGFGIDDFRRGAGFGTKRRAALLIDGWGCDGRRPARAGCDPAREMLIPPDSGRDSCGGDSGGPVLEWTGATWRLLAITSRPAASVHSACGRGGIYVRADVLATWLDSLERTP